MFNVLVKVKGPDNHGFSTSVKNMTAIYVQRKTSPQTSSTFNPKIEI